MSYTIAYKLHRDGHIEPFSLNTLQIPNHPYFAVTESDGYWVITGYSKRIPRDLGYFLHQDDAEATGQAWLEQKP